MTDRLKKAVRKQKQNTKQHIPPIHGSLGIRLGGSKLVEVPTRNSFVYVRLRNNDSEVIQAFNNQVAPAYNLPVIVERQGNRYTVVSVDTERYENNWSSFAPFLPRHGNTHSFDLESGGGGDIVWVYPRQFTPLLVLPSGSLGAGNVVVSSYTLKKDNNSWLYTGNTGTSNLTPYNPSTGAVMVLVYLDANTGNPGLVVGSGTYFSQAITGTSAVVPYIPSVPNPSTQIPLAAVRLVTGTTQISWNNIYDVRQFLHTVPTGTGGGGGVATGTDYDSTYLRLDTANAPLTNTLEIQPETGVGGLSITLDGNAVGAAFTQNVSTGTVTNEALRFVRQELSAGPILNSTYFNLSQNWTAANISGSKVFRFVSNSAEKMVYDPFPNSTGTMTMFDSGLTLSDNGNLLLLKNNGTPKTKIAAQGNIELGLNVAKEPNAGKIGYNLFGSGYLYIVGAGTASNDRRVQLYDKLFVSDLVEASSFNITNPSLTYNITGSPHTHNYIPANGWILVSEAWTRTGNHTFTVSGDLTTTYRQGAKIRYKDGGSFEYGVIKSSNHAAGTTTIDLIVNTSYTMAATTITDRYVSYIENPEGFPKQFNFTSVVTYAGGTTDPTSVTVTVAIWRVVNGDVAFTINASLVRGAGNRTFTIFSVPLTITGVSPIPGLDDFTAAGLSAATACYGQSTSILYFKPTMSTDGTYYINGSVPFT